MATVASILSDPEQRAQVLAQWLTGPLPPGADDQVVAELAAGPPSQARERAYERDESLPLVSEWTFVALYPDGVANVGGLAILSGAGELLAGGGWPTDWETAGEYRYATVTLTLAEGYG